MAMLSSKTNNAIKFNTDFFNQSVIDELLSLSVERVGLVRSEPTILPYFDLPEFKKGDSKAFYDAEVTRDTVEQSLNIILEDPELADAVKESDKGEIINKACENLSDQLLNSTISDDIIQNNRVARDSVQLITDSNNVLSLEVSGVRLFEVDLSQNSPSTFDVILQIATVVLDIFALLCTAFSIAIDHGTGFVKRIAEFIKKLSQSIIDWASKIWGKVGTWIASLRAGGPNAPGWFETVKKFAKEIGSLLVDIVKTGWENKDFIQTIRYCFKVLFSDNILKVIYYLLQLIGGIILMITTAGGSLLIKIILAVIQLGILIWDIITLVDLFNQKGNQA